MGPEVVDPGQGQALPEGQGLGHGHADHQGADEPGPLGHGQAVQVFKRHSGLVQGCLDHRQDVLQVPPGRQLRHHPAVGGVQLELGGHHRGEDAPAVRHYCQPRSHRRKSLSPRSALFSGARRHPIRGFWDDQMRSEVLQFFRADAGNLQQVFDFLKGAVGLAVVNDGLGQDRADPGDGR